MLSLPPTGHRSRERGRKKEAGIRQQFLNGLGAYHQTFPQVAAGKYKLEVLTLDVQHLDIGTDQDEREFLERAERFLIA